MVKGFNKLPLVAAVAAVVMVTSVVAIARPASPLQPAAQSSVAVSQQAAEQAAKQTSEQAAPQGDAVTQLSAEQVRMQQAAVLAAAGRSAMQHISVAAKLLKSGDAEQAREVLATGGEILGQIAAVVNDDGRPADAQRMIPVYARLSIVEGAEVSDALKQGLNELAPMVAHSQHAEVVERLKSFGVGLSYSYVELPLESLSEQVSDALKALDAGDQQLASKYLAAASEAAVLETVNVGFEINAGDDSEADAGAAQAAPPASDQG